MKNILLIFVAILVVGGIVFAMRGPMADAPFGQDGTDEEVDLVAPGATDITADDGEEASDDDMGAGEVERITLDDVSGGAGTGEATRQYAAADFNHHVFANLPEPAGSDVYEGWLVRGKPGDANFHFISTGVMEKTTNGQWEISFSADEDYRAYLGVVITLETIVDATPEAHILEGGFNAQML